jgi:hypothetical protein
VAGEASTGADFRAVAELRERRLGADFAGAFTVDTRASRPARALSMRSTSAFSSAFSSSTAATLEESSRLDVTMAAIRPTTDSAALDVTAAAFGGRPRRTDGLVAVNFRRFGPLAISGIFLCSS